MNFCWAGAGFLSTNLALSRNLPFSCGFGKEPPESGLKMRWENDGVLESPEGLGECSQSFMRIQ